jgi:hypothetical protein
VVARSDRRSDAAAAWAVPAACGATTMAADTDGPTTARIRSLECFHDGDKLEVAVKSGRALTRLPAKPISNPLSRRQRPGRPRARSNRVDDRPVPVLRRRACRLDEVILVSTYCFAEIFPRVRLRGRHSSKFQAPPAEAGFLGRCFPFWGRCFPFAGPLAFDFSRRVSRTLSMRSTAVGEGMAPYKT